MRKNKNIFQKTNFIFIEQGFNTLVLRVWRRIKRFVSDYSSYLNNYFFSNNEIKDLRVNNFFKKNFIDELKQEFNSLIISNFLEHRFDLLGSGWTKVRYGMQCRGFEDHNFCSRLNIKRDKEENWLEEIINKKDLSFSKKIWKLIPISYEPIDWQIDFKSGYRWSEKKWSKFINFQHIDGADIKVPWELSRMQHLPMLAHEFISLKDSKEELKRKDKLIFEFRNQILDFIATNPPGYGVNWISSMDVSIRASNLLIAYDIFCSQGYQFDSDFNHFFSSSIYLHGNYIFNNLENKYGNKNNHYLSNLAGLVFISSYISPVRKTNKWLVFSIKELVSEFKNQFYDEGSNFEGSTSYHRLSSEMILFSTALLMNLDNKRLKSLKKIDSTICSEDKLGNITILPEWYFDKLKNAVSFLKDLTKSNKSFPQIGDNDSGRFLKLNPVYEEFKISDARKLFLNLKGHEYQENDSPYFVEKILDARHIQDIGNAFGMNISDFNPKKQSLDYCVINSFLRNKKINFSSSSKKVIFKSKFDSLDNFLKDSKLLNDSVFKYHFDGKKFLTKNLVCKFYRDFGLYIFSSDYLFLTVRCWSGKKPFRSEHMHFDQLSIDLEIDGKNIISDPGTYVYGAELLKRRLYRSNDSHFSPFSDKQIQINKNEEAFDKIILKPIRPSYFKNDGFLADYKIDEELHFFCVQIKKNSLDIMSSYNYEYMKSWKKINFSPSYGVLYNLNF